MNKFNKISLVLALTGGLFFTQSCVQDDEYSIPPMDCTGLTTTMSIPQLIEDVQSSTEPNNLRPYLENAVIEGYVISSDETGNFFKTISIQDHPTNPTTNGIQIEIDANSLYTQYPIGSKIQIELKGLVAGYDRGVIKLGTTYVQNDETRVGRMPSALATTNVKKTCESVEPLAPKVVNTIAEALKPENINTLVTIKNVQFANPTEDVTYGDAVGLTTVNRQLIDRKGKVVDLRNSGYATFAGENLPTKSGEITVVVSIYNSSYQLYIRDLNDVKFDQDRFEPGQAELPTSAAKFPFLGADFNNWADFLASANNFAYDPMVKEAAGQGINGSGALLIDGQRSANGFVFTTRPTVTDLPANPTKLHFWVKGTAAKSLNIYLYKNDGTNYSFNVGSLTDNKLVTENNGGNNSYTGTINTNGEWKVVQLDLEGLTDINTSNINGNFIAFRVGNNANYNLLVDNITIE
ncbi:DUF5689 domain-containing protein [Faecalibacter bovis]|uniref:DUF5689 domain-containing protein n=1 Tax=Faecalibacter bovis TaxID=2898187 RepID=A0ABX7XEY3_9FLAO|nr:DUF5689 domain-containing protein [Faecalibacter bovis]QTV06464.1 hypothetical protein J9309_03805 [Faecalibacter bovis]